MIFKVEKYIIKKEFKIEKIPNISENIESNIEKYKDIFQTKVPTSKYLIS
jgi:hypothetical protein